MKFSKKEIEEGAETFTESELKCQLIELVMKEESRYPWWYMTMIEFIMNGKFESK